MIVLKQKASLHYGLPPPPAPQPPSPWSSILWGDDRRPRGRRRVACGARVTQLREKVTAKSSVCELYVCCRHNSEPLTTLKPKCEKDI
ncbi:hypothetical protein EAI_09596 [Harpegnathos saltator]|uniref:Uncharacterized protein n=1 Tax=Harpegnathos saltator TaxID=610380 RepID=E2BK19_HARSA|nr:hypothetical protein EAI_09596 [Harpegnathos saltator]